MAESPEQLLLQKDLLPIPHFPRSLQTCSARGGRRRACTPEARAFPSSATLALRERWQAEHGPDPRPRPPAFRHATAPRPSSFLYADARGVGADSEEVGCLEVGFGGE